jgi:hypothetical protein
MIDQARSNGILTQAAERAKSAATKTAWISFVALVLSLIAALLGAMSGRRSAALRTGRD